jgi:hypothetical protein
VEAFYDKNFSMGEFMRQHPGHAGNLTDILIGRVFQNDVGRMFDQMPRAAADE